MIIYKIINLINNKVYIGQDSNNNDNYYGSGKIITSAIKKYGKNNFKKEILEYCQNKDELNEKEIYWITKENSIVPNGYNIQPGGNCSDSITYNPNKENIKKKIRDSWTPEKRKKQSEKRKEYLKNGLPEKTKEKLSLYHFNKNLPNKKTQNNIIKEYKDPFNYIIDIRKKYNLTIKMLYYILKINNIDKIPRKSYQTKKYTKKDQKNICVDYDKNNLSLRKLNEKYNIGIVEIKKILNKNNIKIKQSGFSKNKKTKEEIEKIQKVRGTYIDEQLTNDIIEHLKKYKNIAKVAEIFNIKYHLVFSIKKDNNIKL